MLRRAVLLAAFLIALTAPALAATPQVGGTASRRERDHGRRRACEERLRVPIASITKLMTVLVALEHARPDSVVRVTGAAAARGESSIFLRPGERLTVRELYRRRSSRARTTRRLRDHVGGGDRAAFVELMNAKARALGLRDTRFANADGLDAPGHYSSARDVTTLARVAMRNPAIRGIVRTTETTISGGRRLRTWNDLLHTFRASLA